MTASVPLAEPKTQRRSWLDRFSLVRGRTNALTAPLSAEDQQVQSMPDASPTKWHLAHTSWFFETFVLAPHAEGYQAFDAAFGYLFNSYYEAVGDRWPRAARGLLSRPPLDQVLDYRAHVDAAMQDLIASAPPQAWSALEPLIELGLQHEQQHQELILMDIKHVLSLNPMGPAYDAQAPEPAPTGAADGWIEMDGGMVQIGWAGPGFCFDNEGPRHKLWLEPFRIAARPATCGDYLAFIRDGGYGRPDLWLSDGWAAVQRETWSAPLYWSDPGTEDAPSIFTLHGMEPFDADRPLCHLSLYEADAFARWSGKRLPTEAEWETAAGAGRLSGVGQIWEWTASAYAPYPRYRAPPGAIGEYNGKFMSGQMVLRGGCAATPEGHARLTYRNFFPPAARWAFSGVRLADDA